METIAFRHVRTEGEREVLSVNGAEFSIGDGETVGIYARISVCPEGVYVSFIPSAVHCPQLAVCHVGNGAEVALLGNLAATLKADGGVAVLEHRANGRAPLTTVN